MGNRALTQSQVTLEFALAFIIILGLTIGGFLLWDNLNDAVITETTDYQTDRVPAGQGDITIPADTVLPAGIDVPQVDQPTMAKIVAIQMCECISGTLKQQAIDLYTQQYVLEAKIAASTQVVANLNQTMQRLKDAYNQIPWCPQCCLCEIRCTYRNRRGRGNYYEYHWQACAGSTSNPCVICPSWWRWLGRPRCPNRYRNLVSATCISIKPNLNDWHSQVRQKLQNSMDQTQREIDTNQALLEALLREKANVDHQVQIMHGQIACCGV